MNKFVTGAVIGSTMGALGVMYALTSERERKMMLRRGKKMWNSTSNRLNHMM